MAEAGETPLSFAWNDPFDLDGQLSEDEKLVLDSTRAFAQGYLLPRAGEDYLEERFDREIMTRMGRVGLLGPAILQEYGGAGLARGLFRGGPDLYARTPAVRPAACRKSADPKNSPTCQPKPVSIRPYRDRKSAGAL